MNIISTDQLQSSFIIIRIIILNNNDGYTIINNNKLRQPSLLQLYRRYGTTLLDQPLFDPPELQRRPDCCHLVTATGIKYVNVCDTLYQNNPLSQSQFSVPVPVNVTIKKKKNKVIANICSLFFPGSVISVFLVEIV